MESVDVMTDIGKIKMVIVEDNAQKILIIKKNGIVAYAVKDILMMNMETV